MRWPLLMVLMLAGGMFPPAVDCRDRFGTYFIDPCSEGHLRSGRWCPRHGYHRFPCASSHRAVYSDGLPKMA